MKSTVIIAAGGSGGHILPGIALADTLKNDFSDQYEPIFVGAKGGMEEKLVLRSGYPLKKLRLGSLNRVGFKKRLKTILQLPLAILSSFWILIVHRPKAVIGVGGYASGPIVLVAGLLKWLFHWKVALLEPNSVPGMTNRILGRVSEFIFASFPIKKGFFENKNVIVTGTPIRESMKPIPIPTSEKMTLFIFGGSQGAVGMNTLVLEALNDLVPFQNEIKIVHQTGQRDYERVLEAYQTVGIEARIEKFIYDMAEVYRDASILICRSGASTLSEIAAIGRASILIPLPTAADNHQYENALIFENRGAAKIIRQDQSSGKELAREIINLVKTPSRVADMAKSAASFYRPHAAREILRKLF